MRYILKPFAIIFIKYLQKRYKKISLRDDCDLTNQILIKLKLIQAVLYYFKSQFSAWGYFHPDCVWSDLDEVKFRKLFPEKDFKELDILISYNPKAVTYYHNRIYGLLNQKSTNYPHEIEKQLKKWGCWN